MEKDLALAERRVSLYANPPRPFPILTLTFVPCPSP